MVKTYNLNSVISELDRLNIPDSYRIGKEIIEFSNNSSTPIFEILTKISNGMPWEYIRGYTEFRNHKIFVNNSVLIPRIETETLVTICLREINASTSNLIDIGSGSGAIPISVALESTKFEQIFAIEKSKRAIKVLKKNIKEHNLEDRIKVISGDLLSNFKTDLKNAIIVANLPYVGEDEYENLDISVKDFEPKMALVGGKNGHELAIKLIKQIPFEQVACVILELSPRTIPDVVAYSKGLGLKCVVYKDVFERDRFVKISN